MTATSTAPTDDEPAVTPTEPSWRRALAVGLAAYVVSRLCVVAATAVRTAQMVVDARADGEPEPGAVDTITGVLTSWDGKWYLEIVRGGYPESVPANITYEQLEARAAFFPLFPWLARVVDAVLPGGDTLAALTLNFVLGAVSVVLVGLLARRLYGIGVAARAMTLYAVFPGSVVLSLAYAEALLIVLAAACLLLLLDERWWLAGLTAALATAARPNGIAIVAACAVAAFIAIRRDRNWMALVAVAMAPIGFVFFQWYVGATAGEPGVWFRVQREAWAEGTSFGATAVTNTIGFLTNPLSSPTDALTALTMATLIGMVYCTWKVRLPWPLVAYCAVIVALMLIPETVTARPRFLFTAFPFFIAVAAWWPEPEDDRNHASWEYAGWDLTLVACGAGLAGLTGLYAVFGVIP
ncbi:MAG TPA: mannosyltransferase family protein [Ilumatobacteraceae bacterium]|nr:mannosyltransferase family protein [Ilumatobacteraceae bacterium]